MLCTSCRFNSEALYCGKGLSVGKALEDYCSGYVEGKKATVPFTLPRPLALLLRRSARYLEGIPFPVRGYTQHGLFTTTHTIALVNGDIGYSILSKLLPDDYRAHIVEDDNLCITLCRRYCTSGVGPIVIEVTLRNTDEYHDFCYVDLTPYIWWLDPTAASYAVEAYLEGLMYLYTPERDVIEAVIAPTTGYTAMVLDYLLFTYAQHTKDYHRFPQGEVEYLGRRWRILVRAHLNP